MFAATDRDNLIRRARERFQAWVNRRIPPASSVTLDQKRVFIFPSRVGFFFGLCLLLMLLTAINYQNNMAYALTFLLATLFVVGVLHTYANLAGLTLRAGHAGSAFPGQQVDFEVLLERSRQQHHYALHLGWPGGSDAVVNLVEQDRLSVVLHIPVGERGRFYPGRLLVESTYPLGLLRCWTWVDLDIHALVYPRPLPGAEPPGEASDQPEGVAAPAPGKDDFHGLRAYRAGDSLRHVNWKGLAKGQGLYSKQYMAYAERSVWLDWEMFPGVGTEQRLSQLCYWVLQLDGRNEEYGLRLPGVTIAPASGERHREQVLKALALFRAPESRR